MLEPAEMQAFYSRESQALRDELRQLKQCQLTILISSITATGAILGAIATWARTDYLAVASLAPLVVLLPAWWVFFVKARTISCIVGYYRILEQLTLRSATSERFQGWENALREFRQDRGRYPARTLIREALRTTSTPYWAQCYFIFLALSAICLVVSASSPTGGGLRFPTVIGLAFSLTTAIVSGRMLYSLVFGTHSYNRNERKWQSVLMMSNHPRQEAP